MINTIVTYEQFLLKMDVVYCNYTSNDNGRDYTYTYIKVK